MFQEADTQFKIILVGESNVGKSTLLQKYSDQNYIVENSLPTIGVDFKSKWIKYKEQLIKLNIWDTAGQERFKVIVKNYYKGAEGVLLCVDLSNQSSFKGSIDILNSMAQEIHEDAIIYLIGCKYDLAQQKISSIDENYLNECKIELEKILQDNQIKNNKIQMIFTSSFTGYNLELPFEKMGNQLYDQQSKLHQKSQPKRKIKLSQVPNNRKWYQKLFDCF